MMKKLILALTAAAILVVIPLGLTAQEPNYVIVVHPDNPIASLAKKDVSNIFLRKQRNWEDGTSITPIDLDSGPVKEKFCKDVHGYSLSRFESYWQHQIFSGRKVPPSKMDESGVLKLVGKERGAIGYVSASRSLGGSSVKRVAIN